MPSWGGSTLGLLSLSSVHSAMGHLQTSRKRPRHTFSMFQDADGFLTQRSGGCMSLKAADSQAGHLVLELPRLSPPRHPITKPPLVKSSSRFSPYFSETHTYVISHSQAQQCPLSSNPEHEQAVLLLLLLPCPGQSSPLRTVVWRDEQSLPGRSAPLWLTWKLGQ